MARPPLVAIGKAVAIAEAFNSTVTLIYVIDPYAFTGVGTDFSYGQARYRQRRHGEAQRPSAAPGRF